MTERDSTPGDRPLLAYAALIVVYLVWGSTYLVIRVGVRDLPPLTMAGHRYQSAGLLLYPLALRTGGPALQPTDRDVDSGWVPRWSVVFF